MAPQTPVNREYIVRGETLSGARKDIHLWGTNAEDVRTMAVECGYLVRVTGMYVECE